MSQVIAQFRTFYASLDTTRRRLLWGALALTAVSLLAVGIWASRDAYQVVYTTDDAEAMSTARASLEERSIPYRLSGDGHSLSVPVENAGDANVEIASTGNVMGLELLETISPGTTPQRAGWYYQRAQQGELTRTISSLEVVKACRVHLVLPDDDVFLKSHSKGSASVVLTLQHGRHLSQSQIIGITSLVAGAIKGLEPGDVTLTDSAGNILTEPVEEDSLVAQTNSLTEKRRSEESALRSRVERTLSKFLGSEALFDVAVAVELDDTSTDETKTTIDPSSGVPISEQMTEETSKGDRTAGGVAGSESNLPEKAPTRVTANERTSSQSQTNYEYSRATTHVSRPAGALKRVSASVNVDESALMALVAAGNGERTLESARAELASSIQAAMGYDAERGDTLQVTVLPFNTDIAQAATDLAEAPLDFARYLPYALAAMAMLLVFVFVIRPMIARATESRSAADGVGPDGNLIGVAGGEPAEDDLPLADRLRHLVDNFEAVDARELNRLVEAQTEASTQVLRRWMRSA